MEKKLGKISKVRFGHVGYQDSCLGIEFEFEGKWGGVATSVGGWDPELIKWNEYSKWTEEDRSRENDKTMRFVSKILKQSKKDYICDLLGVPVELEFDQMILKNWRILEEVL